MRIADSQRIFVGAPRKQIRDDARLHVFQIYDHTSINSAIRFIEAVRRRLPVAIQFLTTDHGFTWHLHDIGIADRHILRGFTERNGNVERDHRTAGEEFYRKV